MNSKKSTSVYTSGLCVMSGMFSLFDSSVIDSSLSPFKKNLAIPTDFLQMFSFSNCRSFKPEVAGVREIFDMQTV